MYTCADFRFTTWIQNKNETNEHEIDVVARAYLNSRNTIYMISIEEAYVRFGKPGRVKKREIRPKGLLLVQLTAKAEQYADKNPLNGFVEIEKHGFEYD